MMEFISQYQYPLIGLGVLVIMGLIGYMADQKETGKIAESKKLRKARLEEKKKLKEQQKAEKMRLQEEKKAEKAKLKEQKEQEKANKKSAKEGNEQAAEAAVAIDAVENVSETEIVNANDSIEIIEAVPEEQPTLVEETNDVFVIEEPAPVNPEVVIDEEVAIEEPQSVIFEPAVQSEETTESAITESGEDLSVPFAFASDNIVESQPEVESLKSESSVAFNSLLEEVQAEEASLNVNDEEQFLQSINMTSTTEPANEEIVEEEDALKVFMQPTISDNKNDDMTSDSLDAWKL